MNSFYHPDLTNVAILPYFPPSVLKKVYIKGSLSHRKLYHQTFSSDFISVSKKTSIPSFLPPCDRSVHRAGSLFLAQQASLFPSSLKITYFGSWFANLQTSHFKSTFLHMRVGYSLIAPTSTPCLRLSIPLLCSRMLSSRRCIADASLLAGFLGSGNGTSQQEIKEVEKDRGQCISSPPSPCF